MNSLYHPGSVCLPDLIPETANYIASVQLESGAIPWFKGHLLDPWDHVEAAMGLSIGGHTTGASRAYEWMAKNQEADGGFFPAYAEDKPLDTTRKESHHGAYLATGLWHHYLITNDKPLLKRLWPHVEAAIEFALGMQTFHGEISWAMDKDGNSCPDALVTGCCSIYKSLECALGIAQVLEKDRPAWRFARTRLGGVLARHPERFDRTWESKERFSMDWFYPLLCGVLHGKEANDRLQDRWDLFIHPKRGCRCVSDEPWVTVAESCELVLALMAAGQRARAAQVFSWLHTNRDKNGAYWTGYQTKENIFWPAEQTTWTAGVVIMAVDALHQITPAANLFTSVSLPPETIKYPNQEVMAEA
jgi:hypothetical protein